MLTPYINLGGLGISQLTLSDLNKLFDHVMSPHAEDKSVDCTATGWLSDCTSASDSWATARRTEAQHKSWCCSSTEFKPRSANENTSLTLDGQLIENSERFCCMSEKSARGLEQTSMTTGGGMSDKLKAPLASKYTFSTQATTPG